MTTPADGPAVRKTPVTLADGRTLIYFGDVPARPADYPDRRKLSAAGAGSQARWDWLLGEWVIVAAHRQDRTFQPDPDQCPLCPSTTAHRTEIPAPEYEVVVLENRFPTLHGDAPVTRGGLLTAGLAATSVSGTSAMTDPPKPPPVIRAPSAPVMRDCAAPASRQSHEAPGNRQPRRAGIRARGSRGRRA